MKEILLSQGKVALVDDDMYEYLSQWRWTYVKHYKTSYAYHKVGSRNLYMHSAIMNTPNGMEIDHKDNNGLNNQRCNLRICTHADNQKNMSVYKTNTSGYKGVTWNKRRRKWYAQISVNGKRLFLGSFNGIQDAVTAYDNAARKFHGMFVQTNEDLKALVKRIEAQRKEAA